MKKALAVICTLGLLAACAMPEAKGPARVCVPDSAICYFPDA